MTLVEEYYELNEAEEVPAVWKILQIGFYGTSAGLGLWCGFTMATLRLKFGDRCYLFTEPMDYINNLTSVSDIMWETDTLCDYYQFSFVSSFIVGVIWASLFLMCGKGGKSLTGLPQPWRIIWPSLIFNLIYFLAVLGTSIKIQEGTQNFCKPNKNDKNNTDVCLPLHVLVTEKELEMTKFQVRVVPKTAWGCTMSWLALFFLSLFRIIFLVDFRLYKICVFKIDDTIQNRKEEVLKVTNYEEPRRINFSRELLPRTNFDPVDDQKKLGIKPVTQKETRRIKSINPQFQPNTAFYIMTDKMLGRNRKPKMSPRAGEEAFDKNLPLNSRRMVGSQSKPNEFEDPSFFPKYENDENLSASSTTQRITFQEGFSASGSENEILVSNFDQNDSMIFKKII